MRTLFGTAEETIFTLDTSPPGCGELVRFSRRLYAVAKVYYLYDPTSDTHEAFVLLAEIPRDWWKGLEP